MNPKYSIILEIYLIILSLCVYYDLYGFSHYKEIELAS